MATFDEIKEVRLTIEDPPGFIDFAEVADAASLPATPAPQTAYKVLTNGGYYSTEKTSGAVEADYILLELAISDARIESIIDSKGIEAAVKEGYYTIMRKLGKELLMVKNAEGSESTEYQRIKDLYEYYKLICKDYEDEQNKDRGTNTGRYFSTVDPVIGEGNI